MISEVVMARPLRIEFPGALYHVTSRGNARLPVFEDDHDRERFLAILAEVVPRYKWRCHAYCLMENHYHLLVETIEGNLSFGMRHLNGVYTQWFNRRHSRAGHLFQGRFKAILVELDSYLLELSRYVVLNPVRAGIARYAGNYRWSSYRATAGLDKKAPLLTVDWILAQFGGRRPEAIKHYRRFVQAGMQASSLWKKLKAQCILGGKEFMDRLEPALKQKSTLKEVPEVQRLACRPSLETLFPPEIRSLKDDRNRAIIQAHLEYGYRMSEIAGHLRLHCATIGRIIKGSMFKGKS
jgi:REP element-mobilizing transposase RayT